MEEGEKRREEDRVMGKVERSRKKKEPTCMYVCMYVCMLYVPKKGLCNMVHEYLASCASSTRL